MAANLTDAAHLSYTRASTLWYASTLKAKFGLFIDAVQVTFKDDIPNDRPVGNWLILMKSLHSQMGAGILPEVQFNDAVEQLYRICLAGASQLAAGLISGAQAAALLAAWNAQIGP